jgi:hypothetical protein
MLLLSLLPPYACCCWVQGWLELSLNHGLPSSLLLLSRAFMLPSTAGTSAPVAPPALDSVKDTLLTLPEEVIKDVGIEAAAPATGEGCRVALWQTQRGWRGWC